MKKFALIYMLVILTPAVLTAGTAIYFCDETGAYGASWGTGNDGAAAAAECSKNGGTACKELLVCDDTESGFAAIAISKKESVIGAYCGAKTQALADKGAASSCRENGGKSCKVMHRWHH